MEISEKMVDGALIAMFTGKMDAPNSAMFEDWLSERLGTLAGRLVLDFGGLSYICSSGLRVVLSLAKDMKRKGNDFAICGLYGSAREVFMVSGFIQVLPVYNSVEEAISGG